jgi:hypothetical protein
MGMSAEKKKERGIINQLSGWGLENGASDDLCFGKIEAGGP